MPHFDYVAVDAAGKRSTGRVEAETRAEALRRINEQGIFAVDVTPATGAKAQPARGSLFSSKPRAAELTLFLRELSLLLQAGLTVYHALGTVAADAAVPRLQPLAVRLQRAVASGKPFGEAAAEEGTLFPPGVVGMLKAADATGKLRETLERIADDREREQRVRGKIMSSLTYPLLLLATAVVVVFILLLVIVPQFRQNMADANKTSSTRVMALSEWMTENVAGVATVLGGLLILTIGALLHPSTRRFARDIGLRLPLIGTLMRNALTARFCRTLSLLLANGVQLPDALNYTREAIENERARRLIDQLGVNLRKGGEFAAPLATTDVFPPIVTSMFRVGAESGALATTSARLAEMYEWKLETGMQRFTSILEPAIIVFVSLIIGGVVLSIVQSIFGVYDSIGLPG